MAAAEQKVGAWLQASSLDDEPTVAEMPGFKKSFHDVKPRRPLARVKSVDADAPRESDTFCLHMPRPDSGLDEPGGLLEQEARSLRRSSSMFAQPAQRRSICPSLQGAHLGMDLPRKRRISVISEEGPARSATQAPQQTTKVDMTLPHIAESASEMKKEPRRRTIYVPPEETTLMTIHPGHAGASLASSRAAAARPRRPRRSDVFLEIAEDEEKEEAAQKQSTTRRPRVSLAGAPRRAPLGHVAKQNILPTVNEDVAGSGPGKENLRPEFGEVKRLGKKRASMILPSKNVVDPPTVTEIPSPVRNWEPQVSTVAREAATEQKSLKKPRSSYLDPISALPPPPPLSKPASLAGSRRQSHLPKLPEKTPVPKACAKQALQKPVFKVMTENVTAPELYEENWISHHEAAMTQLMNSLFETVGHAPACVSVTDRGLRQTLLGIHQDQANALLHKRLQASLQFGALCVPHDTLLQVARFKDDLSQRQRFLDLWLRSYNLSALQVCAEVVVGREISVPLRSSDASSSGSDSALPRRRASSKVISTFLKAFLVDNEDAVPRRGTMLANTLQHNHEAANDKGPGWTWRRTVLRSLMLILLLDRAKNAGAIPGCLFQSTSLCKSSNAVVQALSKILLPCIGDIPRVLGHLNYCVSYIQYPLQEYAYRVENLATDLRDGVRLTRLVETLVYASAEHKESTEDVTIALPAGDTLTCFKDSSRHAQRHPQSESWVLSQHVKYPCLGRPQKVYNVQLALSALAGSPDMAPLLSGLTAEDIVDGHREKTVGLLWSLVSRWGLGALVDFALVEREIQRLDREWADLAPHQRAQRCALPELNLEHQARDHEGLLQTWSQAVCRAHGLHVSNLSTSFADGRAFQALLSEYTHSTTRLTTAAHLQSLGCSAAFVALFPTSSSSSSYIPTMQTTIPLLAFLASRLLPAHVPFLAARAIQRAWRSCRLLNGVRQRVVCARLARDCAQVVGVRERIEWAARVLQRRWRVICWEPRL